LKLNRSARHAIDRAKARLGEDAFRLASERGARLNLAEARAYIINAWGNMARQSS
jgi:hypothetical protein